MEETHQRKREDTELLNYLEMIRVPVAVYPKETGIFTVMDYLKDMIYEIDPVPREIFEPPIPPTAEETTAPAIDEPDDDGIPF